MRKASRDIEFLSRSTFHHHRVIESGIFFSLR
jgi:hypothetical protein